MPRADSREYFLRIRKEIPTRGRHKDALAALAERFKKGAARYAIGPKHPAYAEMMSTRKALIVQKTALESAGHRVGSVRIE